MKRAALVVFPLLLGIVVAVWLLPSARVGPQNSDAGGAVASNAIATTVASPQSVSAPDQARPLLGETLLGDYAKPTLPPQNDLTLLSRLMDNFTLLVKSAGDRPLSANEDWAAALRGKNPAQERFLPDHHAALNERGQLVDRWGTPFFFHALGGRRFELRSAGPDRELWTADDIHRNSDGSFRRNAELQASSLLEAASNRSSREQERP